MDVRFEGYLPQIYEKLLCRAENGVVAFETQSHYNGLARCLALQANEGMSRGKEVEATGETLTAPVGTGVWDGLSTLWESLSITKDLLNVRRGGPYTEKRPRSPLKPPHFKCWKRV